MGNAGTYNESELIKGCISNNRKYQRLLYEKYARLMYNICLSYTNERASAQDVLQEGFIKVFKKIKYFKGDGSLEGWIRRIMTNTAIDHLRKKSRLHNHLEYSDHIKEDIEIKSEILDNINAESILSRVKQLPDGAKAVFNLYALEGYTHKEIAKTLNISEGTSKSQFNRAKTLLKDWLREYMQ